MNKGNPLQQSPKEYARRVALKLGLALERRGLCVEAVDIYGNRQHLSQSEDELSVWDDALKAIQAQAADIEKSSDLTTMTYQKLVIYTDGGSRGNPGPSASGYAIYDDRDALIEEGGEYLGITTNNQAEYQALKLALEKASHLTNQELTVRMDSLLVVNQMKGIYKVKNRDLWPVHSSIQQLAGMFKKVRFEHVPRQQNKVADSLVNKILDAQISINR